MTTQDKAKLFVAVYIREFPMMSAAEMNCTRDGLIKFARSRGLAVDAIFEERLETVPDAFTAMVGKLQASAGNVLITPGIHHLAGLGNNPLDVLNGFNGAGIEVLIAGHVK